MLNYLKNNLTVLKKVLLTGTTNKNLKPASDTTPKTELLHYINSLVYWHNKYQLSKAYICHASARLPAFPSTMPHIPSSLDGTRNRKALNGSRSSECGNQTPPSKSNTALLSCGKASANQRLSRH